MNRKFIGKLLIVLILITIVINNVSYAINIEKENLEKALMHLFASDIKITTKSETEGLSGTISTSYSAPTEIKIEEDKILLKEIGEVDGETREYTSEINYAIENNMAEFSMETDVNKFLAVTGKEEIGLAMLGLIFLHDNSMLVSYLAVADYLNIDLNTAASYYSQSSNADNTKETSDEESDEYNKTTTCDLYTSNLYYNETIVKSSIKVNIAELEKVNSSLLDGTVKTTIEFINEYKETGKENNNEKTNNVVNNTADNVANNAANNAVNNTTNNVVNNTGNNAVNNTTNNVVNNTANNVIKNTTTNKVNNAVNNSSTKDNTVTNQVIPAAGEETIFCFVIALISISIYAYIKLKQYDDVK